MLNPFTMLHHICIVVRDIEKTAAYYESIGIGPWQDYPPLSEYSRLSVPSLEAFHSTKYKLVNLQNVQLQLCQPPELDCPQRRFLDTHGEGVYHLGFECDIGAASTAAAELGLQTTMRGRRDNGSGFLYFDTLDNAAVVLMTRQTASQLGS